MNIENQARPVILVADDDPDILALVEYRLVQGGFDVITAEDGTAALLLANQHHPDLCVLDITMPGLTGYEVTRRLRAEDDTARIPVILLTARAQERDVEQGFAYGADDYVTKPFSPQELSARIKSVLSRSRAHA